MLTGAVIVTYNPQLSDLNNLVSNIAASVKQVAIVDNGSKNIADIRRFALQYPQAVFIELGENKGVGYAQNRGIEKIFSNREIDGIILFDHDSHPEPDMVNVLVSECDRMVAEGIKVGAVGPVFIDPRTGNLYPISFFSGFSVLKVYPSEGNSEPLRASFLIASGSLIPRSVYEAIGGMDEALFIDYIDIEWAFRAVAKGYKLFACPGAKMFHQVGDARMKILGREISVHSPLRRYYLARNSIFMLRTSYIDWRYKVREFFFSISRVIVFVAAVNKRGTYLRYIFRGWYDGLAGRRGPCPVIQKNKS